MTDWTEQEQEEYFSPDAGFGSILADLGQSYQEAEVPQDSEGTEYTALFDAPDYASFIKVDQTARSKDYEKKVGSILKAGALTGFRSGQVADAATILHFGPNFAKATGDLTDVSPRVARTLDMITTPDSPWFAFATVATPMVLQFFRNHEADTEFVGKTWREARRARKEAKRNGVTQPVADKRGHPVKIKLPFGRSITLRVSLPRPAVIGAALRSQTHDPAELTAKVLTDDKLLRQLKKQGIHITVRKDVP